MKEIEKDLRQQIAERRPPRVFLSYSHDSPEHQERVLELAGRLRAEGVDARLDQYEVSPSEGWLRWMKRELRDATFVLVVCTETYRRRFDGEEERGKGKGASSEGAILAQEMYEEQGRNARFIPVLFSAAEEVNIPTELKASTWHVLDRARGYEDLYRHLTGQQAVPMPELGRLRELPPKDRRSSFLGEPLAPEPAHRDEKGRELHASLTRLQEQYDEQLATGGDPTATRAELLEVKRQIRAGGQLKPGEQLGHGRYRLLEVLGSGGFAVVWKAWDRRLRQHVAIKVLHAQYAHDATRRERFFRGARQMARLHHPGIVRVLVEELEDEGYHFFVMEYLPGGDLRRAVLNGQLDSEQSVQIVLAVGEALHFAHQQGIVHRDIKPANILLDGEARPRLTDFDLVRAFDTTGGTKTSTQLGTFLYAAPEAMAEGKGADAAADQYSLAMTACFAVLGKNLPPTAIFDLAGFRTRLPCAKPVKEVLTRATALVPGNRFADVRAFLDALRQAGSEPATPPTLAPRPGLVATGAESDTDALLKQLEKGRPGERLAALARLREVHQAKSSSKDLLRLLPAGMELRNLLETGAAELPEKERNRSLLAAIDGLLPRLQEDIETLGLAAWVLDYFPGRSASAVERSRAAEVRHLLLQPLREQHPPPEPGAGWAQIPAGTFVMGSPEVQGHDDERPAHQVTISRFRFGIHPVTNRGLRHLKPRNGGKDWLPADAICWYLAYGYSAWLGGRLPTEAEWEYAARAGCAHAYCDRNGEPTTLDKVGWYDANSGRKLYPVGHKEPNPWGLYDLYGNVWEWVADWKAPYSAAQQTDPWGPPSGKLRVIRGGSALYDADDARAAYRFHCDPSSWQYRGFRVVLPGVPEP